MVNKVVVLHCRHCHIHSFMALFPVCHFRFYPGSANNTSTMASFNARAHRNAFHSAAATYSAEDKHNGRNPPSLWSLSADVVRAEIYVKLQSEFEQLQKRPEDHAAAMEKLDEVLAAIDEPRGSFDKVARRLFEEMKSQSNSGN